MPPDPCNGQDKLLPYAPSYPSGSQNLTGEPECAVIMLSIPSTPIVAKVIRLNVFALPSKLRLVTPMIKVVNALWKEKHPSSLCQHNVS